MPQFPGDDGQSAWRRAPEIIAAEQRILTMADALLTWMHNCEFTEEDAHRVDSFFTHESDRNPGLKEFYSGTTKQWFLEKFDPDANRLLFDLLRATWERRCWQTYWKEN